MFKRNLISPRPEDFKPKIDFGTRIMKPYADTAVETGKMLIGSYGSLPASLGSFVARKVGANRVAENLAQKAINTRNKMGYAGENAPEKAVKTTIDAMMKTYIAANIPNAIRSGFKYLSSKGAGPAVDVVKEVVSRPGVSSGVRSPVSEFVTNNGRDFFLKGRTPTYELNMPTRVFNR